MTPSCVAPTVGISAAALSVDVEDWFHTTNFLGVIDRANWDSCEPRVVRNTTRILDILDERGVKATFFVLGWVAKRRPALIRAIAEAGHEIASHGYNHDLIYSIGRDEFRRDVTRSKHALEDLTGQRVRGYRAPCFSITEWAIDILCDLGFEYDSSVVPTVAHDRYGRLAQMQTFEPISLLRDGFYEVCVSCLRFGKIGIPWGGGGYFRFIPYGLWRHGVQYILKSGAPYVFYIHPWELDPDQPRVPGLKSADAFRQHVNLAQCDSRFVSLVGEFEWAPIWDLIEQYRREDITSQTCAN
jgi:polysaccharide deacetylase family protein (PEP-CTERM system associated)